nr:MAG TPA: hypothetical protein [Caudoviricetes sp.]
MPETRQGIQHITSLHVLERTSLCHTKKKQRKKLVLVSSRY